MAETPNRTVRVPDDVWDALRRVALADDRPVSYIVVAALRAYLRAVAGETVGAAPPRP